MQEKNKKNILLVTRPLSPPWDEASKNFAYFLAKNIKQEINLTILTSQEKLNLAQNITQWPVYSSAQFSFKQKIELIKFLRKTDKKFSVLHFLFTPAKLNVFLIKLFTHYKKVKTIQTVATLREDLYSSKAIKNLIFADEIITYSDYSQEKLEKMGIQKVKRIYPGIDLEKYKKEPKNLGTLALFKLDQNDFIITFPGEYTRLGSIDEVVESFKTIVEKIPEAKLVLACRVKNKKDLLKKQEIMKSLAGTKIEAKIIFTDTFADMPKLYNISDIILFPVHNMHGKFDVPLVIPEAQACEKPVIVSDIPIFREFALPNNSVTIKKGDVLEISKAVLDLYKNPEKRAKLGKSGREFVEANFDIKKIAKQYEEIYEQI